MPNILEDYQEYIRTISRNAPSMKALRLLRTLCLPGYRVLDLGSGFSSYYLRRYGDQEAWAILSVDDNELWLNKTIRYCESKGVSSMGFRTWDRALDLAKEKHIKYDVVFMDLGITNVRPSYIGPMLEEFCSPRTMVLFDDLHKPVIKRAIERELEKYTYLEVGVRDQTLDEFGRYCKLVFRLNKKG